MRALRSLAEPEQLAVVAAALLVGAVGLVEIGGDAFYRPYGRWVAAVLLTSAVLLGVRRGPLVVLAVLLVLQVLVPFRIDAEAVPLYQFAATVIASVAIGLFVARRAGLFALLGVSAFYAISAVVAGGGPDQWFAAGASIFFLVGAWGITTVARSRTELAREFEGEARRLAADREERARAAVADERRRIARELHDAVAHSVSVMVLQVGAVRRTLADDDADRRELLRGVERTGREAVSELHRMLGMLRRSGSRARAPAHP